MKAILAAALAGYGVHLLWSALALGWQGLRPAPTPTREPADRRQRMQRWLVQAGLDDVSPLEFVAVSVVLALLGGLVALAVFGTGVPALAAALAAGCTPVASYRRRRRTRRERAQEAWPRLIEEIRILTASVGRSIPQALFEAGSRAPDDLRGAFDAAHREWLITTDFGRTTRVLKERLADPTADATCETLLVAQEVGGADLDRRLEALAEDRIADVQGRRDARARQAGVRFARLFVLVVPFGMALAGASLGSGRAAYGTAEGQALVMVAMALVLACWIWAGHILRLPDEQRVFAE